MRNPLNKRFLRELKGELAKYIVIFVFMTAVIGLISGFLIADGSMYDTYNKSFEKYNIEDGNFELYSKADESVIDKLEKENVTIYENFYKEENVVRHNNIKNDEDSQSTLRFYVNREEVDKVDLMEGSLPEDINEIAIDRMYAVNNDIKVQDTLTVGSRILKVTGLVALSDYSSLFSDNSDTMFDSLKFGVGVVSQKCFDAYDDTHIHYVYSWLYDNKPEDDKEAKLMADDFVKTISANAILVNYIPQYINQAIHFTGDDIGSDRSMMIVLLYVLIVIMAFVFAVTTNNTIVKEANVIGTLRASGYTRGELLRHYILLPIIVTIFGALVGNILGYTVFKDIFVATYYGSYSLPTYHTLWNADAFLLTTVVPVIIMLVINIVIIGCRLKLSPLKFLRRDLSGKQKKKAMRLPAFRFFNRFRLRIIIQNMPNYITLFIGILFANVLLLFGIMLGPMLTHYQNEITDKLIAKHQYVLKALVDVDDNAAEKYCVKTLATIEGRLKSEDVLVYGVKDNSIYADINTASLKDNEVYITNGYADKFRIKKGDKIIISGTIGDHGAAIMNERNNLCDSSLLKSDCQSLNGIIGKILENCYEIKVMRDPTRGGVITTLLEIIDASNKEMIIYENKLPISEEVAEFSGLLGLNPLYLANEGKVIIVVSKEDSMEVLNLLRNSQEGREAAIIGEVIGDGKKNLYLETVIGAKVKCLPMKGEQLPRIC